MKSVDMVREGGLVAFITSQGVLTPSRDARARVADEPLRARIGHPAAEQPLYRTRGDGGRQRPGYPAKESRHGGTVRTAAGFHRIPQAVERHPDKQPFPVVRQGDPYRGQSRQRPYGKPAMEFTHAEGVDGIDREMRRMLSEDSTGISTRVIAGTCSGTDTRYTGAGIVPSPSGGTPACRKTRAPPCRRNRQGDYRRRRNLQQQREEEEKRRVVAEMAAQATMSIPKPGRLPESKTNPDKRYRILPPHPPENRPGRIWPTSGPGRRSGRIACGSNTRRNPKISA